MKKRHPFCRRSWKLTKITVAKLYEKRHSGSFEEAETDLRSDYERNRGASSLTWEHAKDATRDAWHRVERAIPGDFDKDGR